MPWFFDTLQLWGQIAAGATVLLGVVFAAWVTVALIGDEDEPG